MIQFLQPNFLYLWIPMILLVVFLYYKKSNTYKFSAFWDLKKVYKNNSFLYKVYYFILIMSIVVWVIIIAQPIKTNTLFSEKKDGIDIMIALDVSLSMKAKDLLPNRIEAAKDIITDFISWLESDRLWLVVFSWKPFTSLPLNFDYEVSKKIIENISTDTLNQEIQWLNGTAIWDAIMFAYDSFWNDTKREKVLIIVTDGTANTWIDPEIATKYISDNNQKLTIYTIWIWWDKPAFIEYTHPLGFVQKVEVEWVDEKTLKQIAELWNGKYYRAWDADTLEKIFNEISMREKTELEVEKYQAVSTNQTPFIILFMIIFLWIFWIRIYKNF